MIFYISIARILINHIGTFLVGFVGELFHKEPQTALSKSLSGPRSQAKDSPQDCTYTNNCFAFKLEHSQLPSFGGIR